MICSTSVHYPCFAVTGSCIRIVLEIIGQKENGSYEEERNLIYHHRRSVNLLAVLAVGRDSGASAWSRSDRNNHADCFDGIRKSPKSWRSLMGLKNKNTQPYCKADLEEKQ